MTRSAGVTFWNSIIRAKSIKGFDKIQNKSIIIEGLQQELDRDEVFHGDLSIAGKSLKLSGHSMEVTGNLKLYDTVLIPDKGILTTGGSYGMYGSSILNMLHTLDRLQIGGNFETASSMNHSTVLRNGRIGICGNFRQSGNKYSFQSMENLLIAFMGDYTHYYWFTGKDCFADTLSGEDACVEGKYEKRDLELDMDMQYLDAIYFGIQDGLKEMAESPEDLIKEAAFAAALGMGLTIATPISGFMGMAGVLFSIQAFYQSYEELKNLDDNCARLREVARIVTISVVESIAKGAIRKAGSTVKEAAAEVELLVKKTRKSGRVPATG